MKDFWPNNLFELNKYKKVNCQDSLTESSVSFINYIKEIFPVNGVPKKIQESIQCLQERIEVAEDQYDITIDRVCLEIRTMYDKGELK